VKFWKEYLSQVNGRPFYFSPEGEGGGEGDEAEAPADDSEEEADEPEGKTKAGDEGKGISRKISKLTEANKELQKKLDDIEQAKKESDDASLKEQGEYKQLQEKTQEELDAANAELETLRAQQAKVQKKDLEKWNKLKKSIPKELAKRFRMDGDEPDDIAFNLDKYAEYSEVGVLGDGAETIDTDTGNRTTRKGKTTGDERDDTQAEKDYSKRVKGIKDAVGG